MKSKVIATALMLLFGFARLQAQSPTLTSVQQAEDFTIFTGALQEGHGGLYYFIDKRIFAQKCDSIRKSFREGESIGSYYLKLRYLITLLRHGHSRINLPGEKGVNYKMGVLRKDKQYLPLQLIVSDKKLYVLNDCSD